MKAERSGCCLTQTQTRHGTPWRVANPLFDHRRTPGGVHFRARGHCPVAAKVYADGDALTSGDRRTHTTCGRKRLTPDDPSSPTDYPEILLGSWSGPASRVGPTRRRREGRGTSESALSHIRHLLCQRTFAAPSPSHAPVVLMAKVNRRHLPQICGQNSTERDIPVPSFSESRTKSALF